MHKVIDLFAGAGGLSLGFKQTGKYEIAAAFEINPNAQKTYKNNLVGTKVFSNVCTADYKKLKKDLGRIDIVIGGPPCQGFSKANRQKNHVISQNNMLVREYVRAVMEIRPKAFVMENVEMLKSDLHKFYLRTDEAEAIAKLKIETSPSEIQLLEKKYFSDTIAEDIKSRAIVNERIWSEKDYKLLNIIFRQKKNSSKCKEALYRYQKELSCFSKRILANENDGYYNCFNDAANALIDFFNQKINAEHVVKQIEKTIMIQRCLFRAKEVFDNELQIDKYKYDNGITIIVQSYSVFDYITKSLGAKGYGYTFDKGILNALDFGAPQRRNRFVLIGIKKSISKSIKLPVGTCTDANYRTVRDAIKDIEKVPTTYDATDVNGVTLENDFKPTSLTDILRDSPKLYNHLITKTKETAQARFDALEQGQNFHSLDSALKENTYTDVSRTQNTIYLRLEYNSPSGTVVNVRKSMWIHPTINRAVSVREAARLQTFPDSFVFCGTKDSQYQQVGNAVPPMLAKAIAEHLAAYLEEKNG